MVSPLLRVFAPYIVKSFVRGFKSNRDDSSFLSIMSQRKNLSGNRNRQVDRDLDTFKIVFAEGYMAGKQLTTPTTRWRTFLTALLVGVLIGFLLPIFASSNIKIEMDKDIVIDRSKIQTTFADVKGVDEAKKELEDIVRFLQNPRKLSSLGGKLPKGVLLVGPPGTGKTLLARALAGEAGVPYFQMSGSEFEQLYVGEGARRMRELFKIAKKCAPCVIFIDEIDSVGSKRIHSSMHPHSNQTINQLLTEMDGFQPNEGVIVLAATNRREDLDSALIRRFDVEVVVAPPNFTGRKEVLELFLGNVASDSVDIDVLARGIIGFTGADIKNMVNRAAIRAAIEGAPLVTLKHLLFERDRILMGPESKSRIPDKYANEITAYHEGGHVVVAHFTPFAQQLHKVTIVPRGYALGHTAFLPEKKEVYVSKAQVLARIDSLLGGRAAEELVFGSEFVTSGAANDLAVATELARKMVTKWGMSERLGLRGLEPGQTSRDQIEEEVGRILQESYERAKLILQKHAKEHASLAKALLKFETLDADEIRNIMENFK